MRRNGSLQAGAHINGNYIYCPPTNNELAERLFPLVSLCLFRGRVPVWSLPMMHWASLYRRTWPRLWSPGHQTWDPLALLSRHQTQGPHLYPLDIRPWTLQPPSASDIWLLSLDTCSNLFICGILGVTTGGRYWSTCGKHPIGMLSCYIVVNYFGAKESTCCSWVLVLTGIVIRKTHDKEFNYYQIQIRLFTVFQVLIEL